MEAFFVFLAFLGFVTAQSPAVVFVGGAGYSRQGQTAYVSVTLSCTPTTSLRISPSFQNTALTIAMNGSPPPHYLVPTATWPLGVHNLTIYYPGDATCLMGFTNVKWAIIPPCSWLVVNPFTELNNQVVSGAPRLGETVWASLCPDNITLQWWGLGAGGFTQVYREEGRGHPLWLDLNFGKGCGFAPRSMPNLPTSPAFTPPDSSCPDTCKVTVEWLATTPILGVNTLTWTGYVGPDNYYILWTDIAPVSLSRLTSNNSDVKNYFGRLGVAPLNAPDLPTHIAGSGIVFVDGNCESVTPCVGSTGDCPDNLDTCPAIVIGVTSCSETDVGGKCDFECPDGYTPIGASYIVCKFGGVWSSSSCRIDRLRLSTSHGDFFQIPGQVRTFYMDLPCGHPQDSTIRIDRTLVGETITNQVAVITLTPAADGTTSRALFALGGYDPILYHFQVTYLGDIDCPHTTTSTYYFVAPECTLRVQANSTAQYGTFDFGDFQVGGNVWEFLGTKCEDGIGIQWLAIFDPSQTQAPLWPREKYIGQDVLQSQVFGKCGVAPFLFPTLPTVFSQWHSAYDTASCPVCRVNVSWAVTTAIEGMSGTLNFQGGLCADNYHIFWNRIAGAQTLLRGLLTPTQVTAYLGSCGVAPTNAPDLPLHIADSNINLLPSLSGACPSVPPSPLTTVCPSQTVGETTCPSGALGDTCRYRCPWRETHSGLDYAFCQQDGNWSPASCIATTSQVTTTIASTVSALCAGAGELVQYVGVQCYENKPYDIRWDGMVDITNLSPFCIWHRDTYVSNPGGWLGQWVGACGIAPVAALPGVASTALSDQVSYFAYSNDTHSVYPGCASDTTSTTYVYSGVICNALGDISWRSFYIKDDSLCREDRETAPGITNITRWFGSCGVAPVEFPSLPTRILPSGYLGCFADGGSPRDLPGNGPGASGSATIQQCATTCAAAGTKYFGVQNGNECWCGNQYGRYGTSTGCTVACTGNNATIYEKCGGPWANSVYETMTVLSAAVRSSTQTPLEQMYRPIPINLMVAPPPPPQQLTENIGCPLVFEFTHRLSGGIELDYFPFPPTGPWKLVADMYFDANGEIMASGPCDSITNFAGWAMYTTGPNRTVIVQLNRGHPAVQSVYVWNTGLNITGVDKDTSRHLVTLEYNGVTMVARVDAKSSSITPASLNITVASPYRIRLMRSNCLTANTAGVMKSFRAYACINCGTYTPPSGYSVVGSCTGQKYPTQCQFSCNSPRYLSFGEPTVFCDANGQWVHKGECSVDCLPNLITGPNASPFECDDTIANGGTCDNACDSGFYLSSGSLTRTCTTGSLSAVSYTCSAITCSYSTTLPAHSHVVSGCTTSDAYNADCELACDTGYYPTAGSTTLTCTTNGAHAYTLVCSPITCAESNPLPTGSEIVSGCTMADAFSSTCVLRCIDGTSQTGGSLSRTCSLPASGAYPASDLVCTEFTPAPADGSYTNGYNVQIFAPQILVILSDGATTYFGSFTDSPTHIKIVVDGVTYTGTVNVVSSVVTSITWDSTFGTWTKGAPVPQAYTYPETLTFVGDGNFCFAPGFLNTFDYNFCTYPGSCYYRRSNNLWEDTRGVCLRTCNTTLCPTATGINARGVDKWCNKTGVSSYACANYQPLGATCGGYNASLAPQPPYCDWKSVCLNNGTAWKCANSTCLNSCRYGSYCYTSTTTSDTAICGGYEVDAFSDAQLAEYFDIYIAAGFEPGDDLLARKQLLSQVGTSLIGPLSCTPGTDDCGLSASCVFDTKNNGYYCVSPGLFKGGIPVPS